MLELIRSLLIKRDLRLQFLQPRVEDERMHLIPVLKTMLRLSQEEVELLTTLAKGTEQHGTRKPQTKV